jgi:aspartate--ammonia ligase
MSELIIPKGYKEILDIRETEKAIKFIKDCFQTKLAQALNLERVSAPLFLKQGTGINDDLNGVERKAEFILGSGGTVEAPNSLAKWKRMKLKDYAFKEGEGLYTDMNGIRVDDEVDNLHSHYVDQWDWEKAITKEDRTIVYLKQTVKKIYQAIKETSLEIEKKYPELKQDLPEEITFIHTKELFEKYPDLTPGQREEKAAKEHKAIFIIGIGGKLPDGKIHDGRAPDYDDWITQTEDGKLGLNGDIVVYNFLLDRSFELSSMGIRVSPESIIEQLKERGAEERKELEWHKRLIAGEFPLSIGGGIGQSRLCMLYLQKAHIGEVQSSIWPEDMKKQCEEAGIRLL